MISSMPCLAASTKRGHTHRDVFDLRTSPRTAMPHFLRRLLLLCTLALLPARGLCADGEDGPTAEPLVTVRASDRVMLYVRRPYMTMTETIVLAPAGPKTTTTRPGVNNVIHLLVAPFWLRDGSVEGLAFPMLRPQLTLSHGRVKRFALTRPDGEAVRHVSEATADCRYVLTLEFGHMMPDQLTVTMHFSAPVGLNPGAELLYTPSNDGHPLRSGPTESVQTVVRVIADEPLESWQVTKDGAVIERPSGYPAVTLDRDAAHVFRFGVKEAR